jgi:hypothetical protein
MMDMEHCHPRLVRRTSCNWRQDQDVLYLHLLDIGLLMAENLLFLLKVPYPRIGACTCATTVLPSCVMPHLCIQIITICRRSLSTRVTRVLSIIIGVSFVILRKSIEVVSETDSKTKALMLLLVTMSMFKEVKTRAVPECCTMTIGIMVIADSISSMLPTLGVSQRLSCAV